MEETAYWREPNQEELSSVTSFVSVGREFDLDTYTKVFKVSTIILVFSILIAIAFGMWRNTDDIISLCGVDFFVVTANIFSVFGIVKCKRILKVINSGDILVSDAVVVNKEKVFDRKKRNVLYYYVKVRVVDSNRGGDKDYRTFKLDNNYIARLSIGSHGLMVRYDSNMDGYPIMYIEFVPD